MGLTLNNDAAKAEPDMMMEMNTTPLIDVMLVLIIMFIITIPVQLHSTSLALPVGQTAVPSPDKPEVIAVEVAADGGVRWNGELLTDRAALEARLSQAASAVPQAQLRLRPDGAAPYGAVAAVLAGAQRKGLTQLGMVGNERFAP